MGEYKRYTDEQIEQAKTPTWSSLCVHMDLIVKQWERKFTLRVTADCT